MLLAIDRGNTLDKCVIFNNGEIIAHFTEINRCFNKLICDVSEIIRRFNPTECGCIISSVGDKDGEKEFEDNLKPFSKVLTVSADMPLPFYNGYKSQSLGTDRIAAVAGAERLYQSNVLVIDAGTCITFDYLDKDKKYSGGSISPGFGIKYKALHNFTANLPLLDIMDYVDLCGDTTEKSIASGVINGTLAEIEQTIKNYQRRFDNLKTVITGGDCRFIAGKLSENLDIEVEENLVFWGLKNIYEFNEQKKS